MGLIVNNEKNIYFINFLNLETKNTNIVTDKLTKINMYLFFLNTHEYTTNIFLKVGA